MSPPKASRKPAKQPPARASRRQRDERRRWMFKAFIRTVASLGCIAALASGFVGYLRNSEIFKVQGIVVEGAEMIGEKTVRAVAGITDNDNVLFLDTRAVERRVLSMPYVKHCEVRRKLPDRIEIEISERRPLATLLVNNLLYELDRDAVVLRELDPMDRHPGPFITTSAPLGLITVGQRLEPPAIHRALEVYEAFQSLPLAEEWHVAEIAAKAPNAILMYCDELPFEIRWGRRPVWEQAQDLHLLWRARAEDLRYCQEYLDLRFDNQMACR